MRDEHVTARWLELTEDYYVEDVHVDLDVDMIVGAAKVFEVQTESLTGNRVFRMDDEEYSRLTAAVSLCRQHGRLAEASVIDLTPRKMHRGAVERDGKRQATRFISPVLSHRSQKTNNGTKRQASDDREY